MVKATGTLKTTPDARKNADKDTFAKDFLVYLDDSSKVPSELIESNKASVILEAEQRGLRLDGEVTLASQTVQDKHNVLLTYTMDVKPADADK